MTTTPVPPLTSEEGPAKEHAASVQRAIAWSSFLFAFLQSICTFFAAANGLRFAVGLGSLVLSAGAGAMVDRFHADALRVPMIAFALIGSLLNLAIVAQIRRLRHRPASEWRQQSLTPRKLQAERLQIVLSIATFVLIAIEETLHHHYTGHL